MLPPQELDNFQRRNAKELGRHQKVVAAMRRENISQLRTQRIGAEDGAPQPLGRTASAIAPYGRDTETVLDPRERGTGSLDTPSLLPPQEAIDEYSDETGMANKEAIAPANTGRPLSGETRVRIGTVGAESVTSTEVNEIVSRIVKDAVDEMMDGWAKRYGLDRDLMMRHCSDNNLVGSPKSFHGMPERGGSMVSGDSQIVGNRNEKPSVVFEASGAGRIGFAC